MALRDRRSRETLIPIAFLAIGTAKIELALALHEQLAPAGDERLEYQVGTGPTRPMNPRRLIRSPRRRQPAVRAAL